MKRDGGRALGMTIRDWFAGQFLSSFRIAAGPNQMTADEVARKCYAAADALIAERKKR